MSKPKKPLREAARITQDLMAQGLTKKDVAATIGRDPSLVSQFFTKGKGGSMTAALRAVQEQVHAGERDPEALHAAAQPHMSRRRTTSGRMARVRGRESVSTPSGSSRARAGRQHIASGASRLRPVVQDTAERGGRIAFSVRARQSAFPAPEDDEYPHDDAHRHPDGTEERTYGNHGQGFDAHEWADRVAAANGDVAAAMTGWMVETGQLKAGGHITHLEVRGWGGTVPEPE